MGREPHRVGAAPGEPWWGVPFARDGCRSPPVAERPVGSSWSPPRGEPPPLVEGAAGEGWRPVKVAILTLGTRGDVQPYVALGAGLRAAGYEVTLATGKGFGGLVEGHRFDYVPLAADLFDLMQSAEGRASLRSPRAALRVLRQLAPTYRRVLDQTWEAARGANAIVYHPKVLGGASLAEALGVPGFLTIPIPAFSPTAAFPHPALPWRDLGPLNRASYGIVNRLLTLSTQGVFNAWRWEVLGLSPLPLLAAEVRPGAALTTHLYPYSPHVLPTPPDWNERSIATGYWFLDTPAGWRPPPVLANFLAVGPPPVYVGFGSMAGADPSRLTRLVLAALAAAEQRAVLATGWGGLTAADAPAGVFVTESVPHDWLFPQVAAVVHHGGAGTTAAGLRAGKPTVICPFFGDQPFWGRRVHVLGVGPRPIPQRRLTADRLAAAITAAVGDAAMRARAVRLGGLIRAERGVERAVAVIDGQLRQPGPAA